MDTKTEKSKKEILKKYCKITIATIIYSIGIALFLDPNEIAPGGVTGIAIVLNRLLGMETGTWILLLNIPILILGGIKFGFRFILSTIYSIFLVFLLTNWFSQIGALTNDLFIASITGSGMIALGLGMVFKAGGTTGGTDIIIKILRLKFPYIKTSALFLMFDFIVVAASALVFKNVERGLYAGVAVFVTSYVLELVLYGKDEAKLIWIISDRACNITKRILDELDIGATYLEGKGAFHGKEKQIIMCVMKKQLSVKAQEIVKQEDTKAFMIISSATEIYGEGYKSYFGEKL